MKLVKKEKPLGVCNVCRAYTDQHEYVNHRCNKTVHGRRCYGTFKSGLGEVWDQCQTCHATGKVGTQTCSECAGFGWHLIR
ncbi:MAG: hypothetical protein HY525_16355 [Betaproteobacteria bacterium]|nr:hypothetical protein [Betaproteobacteria bacterium]